MKSMINRHTNGNAFSDMRAAIGYPTSYVGHLIQRIRERREMNRVLGLPDYLLTDIGLRRDEIQRKALASVWH